MERNVLKPDAKIYVAGHRGLVGSALVRQLRAGYDNLLLGRTPSSTCSTSRRRVEFLRSERPEHVFLAAAKVGGIVANNTYPADFIRDNLAIQSNVIHGAYLAGVERLLFLGSSCIYPKLAPQPMRENSLLTGPLEPTNRAYALAKIAGIEMCWSYNRQYGTRYLAAMPTNLYGPGDNYHPRTATSSRRCCASFTRPRQRGDGAVTVWGTGTPKREFMYSDDMAAACVHLMNLPDDRYAALLGSDETVTGRFEPPLVNIGVGEDLTIAELAALVGRTVGFEGRIEFDPSKPDGTPRKLMDVGLLHSTGFSAGTSLERGTEARLPGFRRVARLTRLRGRPRCTGAGRRRKSNYRRASTAATPARYGCADRCQFLGRARRHHRAAAAAAFRAHVDHPVGLGDDVEVVLDHDHAVAAIDQPVQHADQLCDVGHVQADGGFVEHVERVRRLVAAAADVVAHLAQFGDELDALRLAAAQASATAGRA